MKQYQDYEQPQAEAYQKEYWEQPQRVYDDTQSQYRFEGPSMQHQEGFEEPRMSAQIPQPMLFSFSNSSTRLAGLSYLLFWLSGLLVLLYAPNDRLARFHALQSLIFFGSFNALYIALLTIMVREIPLIYGFAIFAFVLLNLIGFVGWIVGMVGAFSGKYTKLPFVGNVVEHWLASSKAIKGW
ncbi:DUF4870 domain-containing protein [Ktedonospora formicarum]|uniref:DUF4870 domain-containing protein n=1 Tax=Ktedonospora formicarum TaxID=2778364 RepID=A0A8J3I118_9CHLR|nr:hypothetical protein [Ktedonospora formicarum]GHO46836.1 hypothetical protein KSX_49990 [Ktedonospora formicarum]